MYLGKLERLSHEAVDQARSLGATDSHVLDAEVSHNVKQIVGAIYSEVVVVTRDVRFYDIQEPVEARVITLSMTDWDAFCRLIETIFRRVEPGMNWTSAASAILGSNRPEEVQALRNAAQARRVVNLALTFDGRYSIWSEERKLPLILNPAEVSRRICAIQ